MDNDQNKIDYYYEIKKNTIKAHPLKHLFLEVTSRCNARCEHCGSSCGDFIPKDEITLDELKKVLDDISAKYDPRGIMLNVTGGEPLVRKDIFEILKYADQKGFYWGMTTNGILINKKVVDKFIEAHIYSISISIDGLKETHENFRKVPGSFNKITRGLRLMVKSGAIPVVQITTCVSKKNLDQLEDLYKLVKKLGVKYWRVVEVDPIGRAITNKDMILNGDEFDIMVKFINEKRNLYKEGKSDIVVDFSCSHYLGVDRDPLVRDIPFFCGTGVYIGSVLSNGDIYVCPNVPRVPELIQGNIRKDNFVDVWEHKFKPFRKIHRLSNNKCKNCKDWKACMGGATHTWDFEAQRQQICHKELFKKKLGD